jgi:hypothetical protein
MDGRRPVSGSEGRVVLRLGSRGPAEAAPVLRPGHSRELSAWACEYAATECKAMARLTPGGDLLPNQTHSRGLKRVRRQEAPGRAQAGRCPRYSNAGWLGRLRAPFVNHKVVNREAVAARLLRASSRWLSPPLG